MAKENVEYPGPIFQEMCFVHGVFSAGISYSLDEIYHQKNTETIADRKKGSSKFSHSS